MTGRCLSMRQFRARGGNISQQEAKSLSDDQIRQIKLDIHDMPEYYGMPLSVIRENSTLNFDLFVKVSDQFKKVLTRSGAVTKNFLDALRSADHESVYTPYEQSGAALEYKESQLDSVIRDPEIEMDEKSEVIYSTATDIAEELFNSPITADNINRTRSVVRPMLESVLADYTTVESLIAVSSYDYYTYTHSVDVSIYSIGLGQALGLERNSMERLAEAAILHDVGKSQIDIAIVNKPGRLTSEEFEAMKMHPVFAYEILRHNGLSDMVILEAVRDHHEKLNGTGYPKGKPADQISQLARIIAIADIFNALTTRRSYKEALTTFDALKIMRDHMEGELDKELLKAFIYMMAGKHKGA